MAVLVTQQHRSWRRVARRVLDGALAALLAAQMCYQLLPETLHAALGLAMVVVALAHLALNAGWIRALGRGRMSEPRALLTIGATAAAVLMAVLALSGLVLSGLVPVLRAFDELARTAHLGASYLALLVMPFHAGLHLPLPLSAQKGGHSRVTLRSVIWLVCACLGVYALVALHIMDYVLLRMPFVLPATVPLPLYLLEHATVMALFALLGALAMRAVQAVRRRR